MSGMSDLFTIACDDKVELADRYATIRAMQSIQRLNPRDYRTMQQINEWKRKHRYDRKPGRPKKII